MFFRILALVLAIAWSGAAVAEDGQQISCNPSSLGASGLTIERGSSRAALGRGAASVALRIGPGAPWWEEGDVQEA